MLYADAPGAYEQPSQGKRALYMNVRRLDFSSRLFYLPEIRKGGANMAKIKEQESEYTQFITCVEDMPAVASDIVSKYCDVNSVDESDIYPSIWNDIITELYIKLFRPCNRLLKKDNAQYNDYDIDRVVYIYNNIYKRLCNKHCQEVSQKGFCDMIGIGKQTLYDWASGRLSSQRSDLQEKIMEDNEESLFSLMKDRRNNPMKILPKLNKVHGWSMPGARDRADTKQALTAADLPQLGAQPQYAVAIDTQTQDIAIDDVKTECT